jgi:hypothetical protein
VHADLPQEGQKANSASNGDLMSPEQPGSGPSAVV